ncbi:hypothetical protein M0651_23615 [Paenibacillus sp. MBLB2552]|uniref:Uncharacterized protein n=1 Tax=Paenibacillus mellifer TaxID=2937794 RepID=A0A9X1Y2E9_9BACL|nr:hypothetical protein [Paenibacillus mellifer]MCK8490155.1 hypothetical protein [Paenibacillus mellifer]
MSSTGQRGHVEFHPPAVKLTADLPGDEQMREHLNELKMNEGFQGSCSTGSPNTHSKRKEAGANE